MLKKHPFLLILIFFFSSVVAEAAQIYVSTSGKNSNSGSKESPVATISEALRRARELRRLNRVKQGEAIEIIVGGGIYHLYEPISIRHEDSGTPDSPTIIRSSGEEKPVITGGIPIENWKKVSESDSGIFPDIKDNVWVADLPTVGGNALFFRQMWVNGEKAKRATNFGEQPLDRILSVDAQNQIIWIPTPQWNFENVQDVEFVIHQWWSIANLRVKSMEVHGDRTAVKFHQPESKIEFEHPWPAPFIDSKNEYNGNSAFFLTGASELLNNPGEWYIDRRALKIYYYPQEGEIPNSSEIVIPGIASLLQVKGNIDLPVSHIQIKDLSFQHTTWMRPSEKGHVPLQAGWSLLDAYKLAEPGTPDKKDLENQAWLERQPAAVSVENAFHIRFEGCEFEHLAATGIDFIKGVSNSSIAGNSFRDIGGTAIQAGFFGGADFEAHLPYRPADDREIVHHVEIQNNYIKDATNEDWGCLGICVGVAHDISISHNDISDVNYSGISVGWSWTKTISIARNNLVFANRIHRFAKQIYDVGGIYMLSAQPNSLVSENAIYDLMDAPYAHMPHHHQYIYFDEGSSYIRAKDNWTEKDKFFSNSPGPGNEWENNGPTVSQEIRKRAGLQPEYQYLKQE